MTLTTMTPTRNVLLIDDDNIFNFLNKEIMKMENFAGTVNSNSSAANALKTLGSLCDAGGKDFPDMIFLDINMPRMDGWEFLDEYEKLPQKMLDKCKVFMLTSSIDPGDMERSKKYKCVKDFFSKPLSTEILESIAN
jgi:CheY-like chemotaxis protein